MFSQTVEYALRAMVCLADRGHPTTIATISEITRVPAPYLAKVLQSLHRAGMVRSLRGLYGGYRLAKAPAELTIWDVVDCVEPIQRIRNCPLGLHAHSKTLCPLHRRLDEALATVEAAFKSCTLADLLNDPSPSKPLCTPQKLVTIGTGHRRERR
jgi:Rrf2 family protein